MNIEDHPAFKELAEAVGQLSADRRQALNELLQHPASALLTIAEVARILAVHESTVRRWIQSGQLRATRLPRYRIHPLELARFLRSTVGS